MAVKKKFDDLEEAPVPEIREELPENDVSDSESSEESSDDEAPEEELVSAGLKNAELIEEERLKAERAIKQLEKAKRRGVSLRAQKQLEEKKLRESERKEESDDEIPDMLPEELLEAFDSQPEAAQLSHKNFEEDPKEIRKQLKKLRLQQLKQLQKMKNQSVKKGPVVVSVLKGNGRVVNNKKVLSVPVSEHKITGKRDKWLQRKSLGKPR